MKDIKEKIIIFLVGLLVGSVITTGAFCAYTITSNNHNCKNKITQQAPGGQPPSMNNNQSGGQQGTNNDSNNQNSGQNNGQPPEKPSDSQTTQSSDNNQ